VIFVGVSWRCLSTALIACIASGTQCANPTSVHVKVFTDVACDSKAQASLVTAATANDLASALSSSTSTACAASDDGTNALGDVMLLPGRDKNGSYAFELMIRPDGMPAEGCNDPKNAGACIVARRAVNFVQYKQLEMRVDLRTSCLGVVCSPDQTCVRGQCVNASVVSCGAGCDESILLGNTRSHLHRIAGGAAHTCVITSKGGVQCWGSNVHGELGNGTTIASSTPVDVQGLGTTAISLAAGQNFTCALLSTRTVMCWGKGDFGEQGNNSSNDNAKPGNVIGLSDATSLAAGCKHMCASTRTGVKCWGWNDKGQVGDGTTTNRGTAVDVQNTANVDFVAAGFHTSCAGTSAGGLCWGDDGMGELGDGKQTPMSVPVAVTQLPFPPLLIAEGAHHAVAVGVDAQKQWSVAAWGMNPGTGGISGGPDDMTAGDSYTCVLQNAAVSCFGNNDRGQLGTGMTGAPTTTLSKVTGLANVTEVAAGFAHACARTSDGKLHCWGANDSGQLGDGSTTDRPTPVVVVPGGP
jgi:alpha-tubulin suppressor-like RCC1 family protein